MNKTPTLVTMVAAATALWFTGCEVNAPGVPINESDSHTESAGQNTTAQTTPQSTVATTNSATTGTPADPTAPPVGSIDDISIAGARLLGPHADVNAPGAAITRMMFSCSVGGGSVRMSFEALNWPEKGGKKTIDGSVFIFWPEGTGVVGGYFDAHSVGQTVKGLENITGGYLDGRKPPKGSPVYFALVSIDGKQRTNVKRSASTW